MLFGLSAMRRTGDAHIGPNVGDVPISADVRVGVDNLNMTGSTKVSFLGLKVNSPLELLVQHVDVNIKAYLDHISGKPVISEVSVVKLDGVAVKLAGLGMFSSFLRLISQALVAAFKGSIKGFIERAVQTAANFAVNKTNMRFI